MELLGLTAKELYELSKQLWVNSEKDFSSDLKTNLKNREANSTDDILRIFTELMSTKYVPLVLTHVIEANNVKITSQLQELLKK